MDDSQFAPLVRREGAFGGVTFRAVRHAPKIPAPHVAHEITFNEGVGEFSALALYCIGARWAGGSSSRRSARPSTGTVRGKPLPNRPGDRWSTTSMGSPLFPIALIESPTLLSTTSGTPRDGGSSGLAHSI